MPNETFKDIFGDEKSGGIKVNGVNIFARSSSKKKQKKINDASVAFALFCDREHSSENINFLYKLQALDRERKKTGREPKPEVLDALYQTYIVAPRKDTANVNLNYDNDRNLKKAVAEGNLTLDSFAPAANEVMKMMGTDTLKRFNVERKAKIRFEAHNFSKIKNLSKRIDAIEKAIAASKKEAALGKHPGEIYQSLLTAELEEAHKQLRAKADLFEATEHFKKHNFPKIKDLGEREQAITAAINKTKNIKKMGDMDENVFKIYKDLLDKEVQIQAQIRFQGHKFSKFKDLNKREVAISDVQKGYSYDSTKSPVQTAYKALLKNELGKTRGELNANACFKDHNFSEIKDLSKREEAITLAIANAGKAEARKITPPGKPEFLIHTVVIANVEKEMGERAFPIYKGLLVKELQKTQKAQKGIIYKLKSAVATFLPAKKKPVEDTQPDTTALAQPPVVGTAAEQKPEPAEPSQDERTPLLGKGAGASEQEAVEVKPTEPIKPIKPTKPKRVKPDTSTQTSQTTPPPSTDVMQGVQAAPAEQKPEIAVPPQDQSTASPKAPPPQPEAPKPTAKPPRKLHPSLVQQLADLKKTGEKLQAGPPNPAPPAGRPLTTQKAAKSTPSMQELAKPPKTPTPPTGHLELERKEEIEPSTKLPMPPKRLPPKRP